MNQVKTEENNQPVQVEKRIPDVLDLFKNGWHFARRNLSLVGLMAIPFCVVEIFRYLAVVTTGSARDIFMIAEGLGSIIALVFYILFFSIALYSIAHSSSEALFSQGFSWAKQNFWSLVWIGILSALIFIGGFMLFIIPGIIVAVYMSLSQMVLVNEGVTGFSSLMRSHDLIKGNWWSVFVRLFGVQLLFFVSLVIAGIVVGLFAVALGDEVLSEFILNIVFTVFGAAGVLVTLSATKEIYAFLVEQDVEILSKKKSTGIWYKVLICLGVLIPVMVGIFATVGVLTNDIQLNSHPGIEMPVSADLILVQERALDYYSQETNQSYSGVCAQVQELISEDVGTVVCNESPEEYALSVSGSQGMQCIDSTGYLKNIYIELEDRTRCLNF
jgi:hypothetical protein